MSQSHPRIAIIGGGPGGYEAALVAAQLGAEVTVVDTDGLGGACVLTDCVPSKTLIETSGAMAALTGSAGLGIRIGAGA
ncbi:MAG TPA: FAD-dependent oxidoreductase, partial [Mycobacteriales bacterium]|nr:FAD-dependent oxidoreductase [Mycobacteriales bacterium]